MTTPLDHPHDEKKAWKIWKILLWIIALVLAGVCLMLFLSNAENERVQIVAMVYLISFLAVVTLSIIDIGRARGMNSPRITSYALDPLDKKASRYRWKTVMRISAYVIALGSILCIVYNVKNDWVLAGATAYIALFIPISFLLVLDKRKERKYERSVKMREAYQAWSKHAVVPIRDRMPRERTWDELLATFFALMVIGVGQKLGLPTPTAVLLGCSVLCILFYVFYRRKFLIRNPLAISLARFNVLRLFVALSIDFLVVAVGFASGHGHWALWAFGGIIVSWDVTRRMSRHVVGIAHSVKIQDLPHYIEACLLDGQENCFLRIVAHSNEILKRLHMMTVVNQASEDGFPELQVYFVFPLGQEQVDDELSYVFDTEELEIYKDFFTERDSGGGSVELVECRIPCESQLEKAIMLVDDILLRACRLSREEYVTVYFDGVVRGSVSEALETEA